MRANVIGGWSAAWWLVFLFLFPGWIGCSDSTPAEPCKLSIATATEGGTYYPVGRQLALALERMPGGRVEEAWAWTTPGSIANIRMLARDRLEYDGKPDPPPKKESPAANVDRDSADLAFINIPALVSMHEKEPDELRRLRSLAALQLDVIQVVARKDAGVERLEDFAGKKVYIGRDGSGTRLIAEDLFRNIAVIGAGEELGYGGATDALVSGELDGAVFAAGTPTKAVRKALKSEVCKLVDVLLDKLDPGSGSYDEFPIPAGFYKNQEETVSTVGTWAILCCRKDLDDDLAQAALEVLHENIDGLLLEHAKIQQIRLDSARGQIPKILPLHPGAEQFWEREQSRLRIATASVSGRYYRIGKGIQDLLARKGIESRVIHTEGSVQNIEMLSESRPTIAIVQRDVAVAYRMDDLRHVYDLDEDQGVEPLKEMLRLASLHEEKAHIIIRRSKAGDAKDVCAMKDVDVSIGPAKSGSRLVAMAILNQCEIKDRARWTELSVPESVRRFQDELIDGFIFITADPSEALRPLLATDEVVLLSVDSGSLAKLIGPILKMSEITEKSYLCLKGGKTVSTISTQAVLVANDAVDPELVKEITATIVEGMDYLPLDIEKKMLAADLPSLPLHPMAQEAYREAGILPPDPSPPDLIMPWINVAWKVMACFVILIGAYKGLLKLRRDRISGRIEREIHSISLSEGEALSVTKLREIQRDLRGRVRMHWWQWRQLDRNRWGPLNSLIENRIGEAKERLYRAMVAEIRALNGKADPEERSKASLQIRELLWQRLENGEIDPDQLRRLLGMLSEMAPAGS